MSHVQVRRSTGLKITDLDLLGKAAARCGMELVRDRHTFRSWQRGLKCDHLLLLRNARPGTYEVGVTQKGKEFELAWDPMCSDLRRAAGENLNKLGMFYEAEACKAAAVSAGNFVSEKVAADGSLELTVTVPE